MKNKVNQPIYKLDPTSDRYRICPYCQKPHMVSHLGKDYCCDSHADKHYNEKRRLKNHAEKMLVDKQKVEDKEIDKPENIESVPMVEISPEQVRKNGIEKNVAIFDAIEVDPDIGSIYERLYLEGNGVDFHYYSYIQKNEGVRFGIESNYLIIKNYKIERVSKNEVRITKKINFKN